MMSSPAALASLAYCEARSAVGIHRQHAHIGGATMPDALIGIALQLRRVGSSAGKLALSRTPPACRNPDRS